MWLLAAIDSTVLFMAGVLLVIVVLLRRTQRNLKSTPEPKFFAPSKPAERQPPSHHLDAPQQMARWEVQMHELARDLSGQLDSKIRIVEQLLRSAEEQAARLEAAIARAAALGLAPEDVSRAAADSPQADAGYSAQSRPCDGPRQWPGSGDAAALAGEALGGAATAATRESAGQDERYREIYELAAAGYSSASIAHRVGSPIGEVELILSLRSPERAIGQAGKRSDDR